MRTVSKFCDYSCQECNHKFRALTVVVGFREGVDRDITKEPCPQCQKMGVVPDAGTVNYGSGPALIDPVRLGRIKPDAGFREVLQKIHANSPGSNLNQSSSFL